MGATLMEDQLGTGITFACATCHSADLFGVKVLGLTNRFPRANHFFLKGVTLAPYVNSFIFKEMLDTTEEERIMLLKAKKHLKFVGAKIPISIGLDTSLAQVALSLAKREQDEYATMTRSSHKNPRPNKLESMISDSKPSVWWNLKYKNRWLSDGSIVSGNPVHTNFLWNEIGRGADLKELETWLKENKKTIDEITAAVFASKPPRYEKFFGEDSINIEKAKRGQQHFVQSCQKCHGTYDKGWDQVNSESMNTSELLRNVKVTYHTQTPVKDVGTDPGRYLGMREFADDLNRLNISKTINAVVEPQKGYVPPPLDGIWSRWPYFHNNSAPTLCAVLTRNDLRPVTYWAGPAIDKKRDFDDTCVGYPTGARTPAQWKTDPEYLYDSRKEGLSNRGHDERIFIKDGAEIYSNEEKLELIEFLKTL
jgi:mono/diheme cytochrome c family protein